VHYWLREHPEARLVVLDALTYAGIPTNLEPALTAGKLRFVRGDICDRPLIETLLREESIDTLVHLAAETHVDRSIADPETCIRTNIDGTHSLLSASRKVWLDDPLTARSRHRFHQVSTDEVYGSLGPGEPPFTETTAYIPSSPYAASKAAADHLVRAWHRTYGLQVTVSNCSNNYGPYQYPEKLIPRTIVNILQGQPIPLYGDGLNIRDWLHVDDHAHAIDLCLYRGRNGNTYNIGGGNERTNREVVELICRLLDEAFAADATLPGRFPNAPAAQGTMNRNLIRFVADRPGHDRRYAMDSRVARRDLGFQARCDFTQGIRDTIAWYLENESWWRPLLDAATQ